MRQSEIDLLDCVSAQEFKSDDAYLVEPLQNTDTPPSIYKLIFSPSPWRSECFPYKLLTLQMLLFSAVCNSLCPCVQSLLTSNKIAL